MDRVFIQFGGFTIYWYGVMMALAFVAAIAHVAALGRREGRPPALASELGMWMMLAGIVGARVAYVMANWSHFVAAPSQIFNIREGGIIFYGGLIGACLAFVVYARRHRERLWPLADLAITALPLGHAIGRIGCFLNGCCYGAPTTMPWAVHAHNALCHPVQLYETMANLAVYAVLLVFYLRAGRREGRVFALYLMLYAVVRFSMEFFRGDERVAWLGLNVAQDVSLALFVAGLLLWFLLPNRLAAWRTGAPPSASTGPASRGP